MKELIGDKYSSLLTKLIELEDELEKTTIIKQK